MYVIREIEVRQIRRYSCKLDEGFVSDIQEAFRENVAESLDDLPLITPEFVERCVYAVKEFDFSDESLIRLIHVRAYGDTTVPYTLASYIYLLVTEMMEDVPMDCIVDEEREGEDIYFERNQYNNDTDC